MDSLRKQWALERRRGEEEDRKGRGQEGAREKRGDGKRRVGWYMLWMGGGGEKMRREEEKRREEEERRGGAKETGKRNSMLSSPGQCFIIPNLR